MFRVLFLSYGKEGSDLFLIRAKRSVNDIVLLPTDEDLKKHRVIF